MARETTKSGKLGDLSRFNAALAANAAELPYLEGARLRQPRGPLAANQKSHSGSPSVACPSCACRVAVASSSTDSPRMR